ncbi:hypothetical protein BGZ94_007957, partial [Podila epigama]
MDFVESSQGLSHYTSQVAVWDITPKVIGFHPAFQELSTRRNDASSGQPSLTFVMVGERRFTNKFVSSLAVVPRNRELVVGFSNGTVLGLESCIPGLPDIAVAPFEGFRLEQEGSAITALQSSPNGLSLLTSSLNGHIDVLFTQDTREIDVDLESFGQIAIQAVLNEWDYSDIIATVVRAVEVRDDQGNYDNIVGAEDSSMLEPFMPRSSVLRRMLAFQLVLFQALPQKIVQYRATNALIQLQSIGEIFMGCCTSDPATLAAHLDVNTAVGTPLQQLAFDTDSLWSLFPLSGWVLDFCTLLFKELTIFLNMRTAGSGSGSGAGAGAGSGSQPQPQSVPDGQSSPQSKDQHAPSNPLSPSASASAAPTLLSFLYHSRARSSLRSVLILAEQYLHYVRIRVELYMRVVHSGGAIDVNATNQGPNTHTNSMSLSEAVAMKDIQLTILAQYVQATFARCPVTIEVAKSMLKDLNGLGTTTEGTNHGHGGVGITGTVTNGEATLNGALDKDLSDHIILIRGVIPTTAGSASVAQATLRMMTRRYPKLWDMNRLVFATMHWLDLEPASPLVKVTSGSKQRVAAIHPSRCRIDPTVAFKTRPSTTHPSFQSGRFPPGLQQHGSSLSTVSAASRGSFGNGGMGSLGQAQASMGRSNSMARIFTESPSELPLSQQASQQLSAPSLATIGRGFSDGSTTMATVGSFSAGDGGGAGAEGRGASGGVTRAFDGTSACESESIWGIPCESDVDELMEMENDDEEGLGISHIQTLEDDEREYLKPIWQYWAQHLHSAQESSANGGNHNNSAELVPDDEMMQDEDCDKDEDEEDEKEDDEEEQKEEEMKDGKVQHVQRLGQGQGSRRSSKRGLSRYSRRSSLTAALPRWLVQESRTVTKRTRMEWTVFPVLSEERESALLVGADMGRMGQLGLKGRFAPSGFQQPARLDKDKDTLVQSYHVQSMIEAQVRKRRFGTDVIRKVKKYKTSGSGRQCI